MSAKIRKAKFLAVSQACQVIFWPTPAPPPPPKKTEPLMALESQQKGLACCIRDTEEALGEVTSYGHKV